MQAFVSFSIVVELRGITKVNTENNHCKGSMHVMLFSSLTGCILEQVYLPDDKKAKVYTQVAKQGILSYK